MMVVAYTVRQSRFAHFDLRLEFRLLFSLSDADFGFYQMPILSPRVMLKYGERKAIHE